MRALPFSLAMMKAYLDGIKSQTRRVIIPQPPASTVEIRKGVTAWWEAFDADGWNCGWGGDCPYGRRAGIRLVITEPTYRGEDGLAYFRADDHPVLVDGRHVAWAKADGQPYKVKALPPRYMPRVWSRAQPAMTKDPYPGRIQEISPQDAWSEGIDLAAYAPAVEDHPSPVEAFRDLWDSINAKRGYGWDPNPWAWNIAFEPKELTR